YQYELDEGTDEPRIWSYGPDKEDGTEDDIISWDEGSEDEGDMTGGQNSSGVRSSRGGDTKTESIGN
ncbi:MAG: hypothetical protein Q4C47_08725, partial [Planctomycetia bacterium]|nr:hypothetical protein [Planctomycetia bacterium]